MTPPEQPIPVQLCVQGGAAKIALLAAFMDAVEELHNNKTLRVTNIAGTSAGAIVGTLFAAAVPMATVRTDLKEAKLDKIVPRMNGAAAAWALARGTPLWNEEELRNLLVKLFAASSINSKENPKEILTFDDIQKHRSIKTRVVATNLTDTMAVVRQGGDAIVSALLDSAALPFFFRAQGSVGGTTVDGGLCENLPIDYLPDSPDDGPIVGVSFRRTAGVPPRNVREYCLAVVSAGIDHSVDRAKRLLEERATRSSLPHEVYLIDSGIESFDFEKAVRDGLGDAFGVLREKAFTWLKEFVDKRKRQIEEEKLAAERKRGQLIAKSKDDEYYKLEMPKNLARLYKTQHEPITLRWMDARMEVTVSASDGRPDTLHHSARFHTRRQPVWCHRSRLLYALQSPTSLQSSLTIYGPDNQEVPYYLMLMDEDSDPTTLEWLICFEKCLAPETGPYTLVMVDSVQDFMQPLRSTGSDVVKVTFHRREGTVDQIDVIAYLPASFPEKYPEPMVGAGKFFPIPLHELIPNRPPDHRAYGFRGLNVTSDTWGMHLKNTR